MNLTFTVALDNIDRMLIQIELTVIAGDHESYSISARTKNKQQEYYNLSVPGTADYVLGSRRKQMKSQITLFSLSSEMEKRNESLGSNAQTPTPPSHG